MFDEAVDLHRPFLNLLGLGVNCLAGHDLSLHGLNVSGDLIQPAIQFIGLVGHLRQRDGPVCNASGRHRRGRL